MLRLTIFGRIAVFLGLAIAVLAGGTEESIMARRSIRGKSHAIHAKGHQPHRYHKPPVYHQPAPVSHNCPNTPYYIQASFNNNYAVLVAMPAVAPDAFAIYFNATEEATATIFTFSKDAAGICQLTVAPSDLVPKPLGFRSVVEDQNANSFAAAGHVVFIQGPGDSSEAFFARELGCQALKGSELFCSVTALGEPTQNMLFLTATVETNVELAIGVSTPAGAQASNFTLIPVVGQ